MGNDKVSELVRSVYSELSYAWAFPMKDRILWAFNGDGGSMVVLTDSLGEIITLYYLPTNMLFPRPELSYCVEGNKIRALNGKSDLFSIVEATIPISDSVAVFKAIDDDSFRKTLLIDTEDSSKNPFELFNVSERKEMYAEDRLGVKRFFKYYLSGADAMGWFEAVANHKGVLHANPFYNLTIENYMDVEEEHMLYIKTLTFGSYPSVFMMKCGQFVLRSSVNLALIKLQEKTMDYELLVGIGFGKEYVYPVIASGREELSQIITEVTDDTLSEITRALENATDKGRAIITLKTIDWKWFKKRITEESESLSLDDTIEDNMENVLLHSGRELLHLPSAPLTFVEDVEGGDPVLLVGKRIYRLEGEEVTSTGKLDDTIFETYKDYVLIRARVVKGHLVLALRRREDIRIVKCNLFNGKCEEAFRGRLGKRSMVEISERGAILIQLKPPKVELVELFP